MFRIIWPRIERQYHIELFFLMFTSHILSSIISYQFFNNSVSPWLFSSYHHHHHHHLVLVARISLTISRHFPYRSSPQAALLDNIQYPHIAAECMFMLVVLFLPDHMWGSIRVHHLWARPYFSSSVLHVWFV